MKRLRRWKFLLRRQESPGETQVPGGRHCRERHKGSGESRVPSRAKSKLTLAQKLDLILDYSAARQRKVCSSGQPSDMVKEMK